MAELDKLIRFLQKTFGNEYDEKIVYVAPLVPLNRGEVEIKNRDIFNQIADKAGTPVVDRVFFYDGWKYKLNLDRRDDEGVA